jgi:hypothetical protein
MRLWKKSRSKRRHTPAQPRPFGRGQQTERSRRLYAVAKKHFEKQIEDGNYTREEREYALTHDMLPSRPGIYDYSTYAAELFVTDVEITASWMILSKNPHKILLDNKLITHQLLSPHVTMPKIHAVYKDGKNVYTGAAEVGAGIDLFATVLTGRKGKGATHINRAAYDDTVRSLLKDQGNLIITEYIEQIAAMNELFPDSLNTTRIVTLRDQQTGPPRPLCGVVRVGTEASKPVDNFGSGGVCFELDMETGQIRPGLRAGTQWEWMENHPDTGTPITGRTLPGSDRTIQKCVDLHALLPFWPIIGWDIALGADGLILIEANATPNIDFHQAFRPLLLNPRVKDFYQSLDVL